LRIFSRQKWAKNIGRAIAYENGTGKNMRALVNPRNIAQHGLNNPASAEIHVNLSQIY